MLTAIAAMATFASAQHLNSLTSKEIKEGWKLLFDGKSTSGWHNFKKEGVQPGWVVKDGILTVEDPEHGGDIVTNEKYDWFELQVDFRLTKGGNSGVMIHCSDVDGEQMWNSGPEIQIYDFRGEPGAQKSGFLYDLYSSEIDSSKPVGEWNHFRIIIAPRKWATYLNGTKYWEFEPGTQDFWDRVANCKFKAYPYFARLQKGTIGLQGDHGVVSFRNIKVKPLKFETN